MLDNQPVLWNQKVSAMTAEIYGEVVRIMNCTGFGIPLKIQSPCEFLQWVEGEHEVTFAFDFNDARVRGELIVDSYRGNVRFVRISSLAVEILVSDHDRSVRAWIRRLEKVAGPIVLERTVGMSQMFVVRGEPLERLRARGERCRNRTSLRGLYRP